jgi:hypothetical protein
LEVTVEGRLIGEKILAATHAEAEKQLQGVRELVGRHGLPTDAVSYIKPDDWPVQGLFAGWAS